MRNHDIQEVGRGVLEYGHDCLPRVLAGVHRAPVLGMAIKINAVLLSDGAERRLRDFLRRPRTGRCPCLLSN